MKRYKKLPLDEVQPGMTVRFTRRYQDGWATEVYEGRVVQVHKDTDRRGIIGNAPLPDKITAIEGVGDRIYHWRDGWVFATLETALPPLPTTPGSVIKCSNGKAAILVQQMDQRLMEEETVWLWSDLQPRGLSSHEKVVPEEFLASAEILHDAGSRV